MSHVDEGTLHAYLDGELAPVERERVDTHLKGCPVCQARLAEERTIIERASRLLGMATPPERAMPPLTQLRQPPLTWRLRRPLAWAATLILAVGLGWYARDRAAHQPLEETAAADVRRLQQPATQALPSGGVRDSASLATPPQGHLAMRAAPKADSIGKDRDALRRQPEAAEVATGAALGNAVAARDTASVATLGEQKAATAAALPRPTPSGVTVRGQAAAPAPSLFVDGPARQRAAVIMSTTWPLISRQPAREVLGVEPVVIPGFAVRAYRRNPATHEIAVEQVTDAGTTISLIERRIDPNGYADSRADSPAVTADSLPPVRGYVPRAMAKAVNERLARFVGSLRIEIEGPLTPDSLSSLLELAR